MKRPPINTSSDVYFKQQPITTLRCCPRVLRRILEPELSIQFSFNTNIEKTSTVIVAVGQLVYDDYDLYIKLIATTEINASPIDRELPTARPTSFYKG